MKSFLGLFNYGFVLLFILFGFYVMIAAGNLLRKVIGLVIFQNAVILFFISLAFKWNSHIPILPHDSLPPAVQPEHYANPLPHALMLTAIVVGVSTLGVALALTVAIFQCYHSLEESEILKKSFTSEESHLTSPTIS